MRWTRRRRALDDHDLELLELAFIGRLTLTPTRAPGVVECALSAGVHPRAAMRWARTDLDFAIRMTERLTASMQARVCERDLIGRTAARSLDEQLDLLVDRRMRQSDELAGLTAIVPHGEASALAATCAGELRRSVDVALERWVAILEPSRRRLVVDWIDDMLSPERIERLRTLDYAEHEIHEMLLTQVRRIAEVGGLRRDDVRRSADDSVARAADLESPPSSSDSAG